jgi:hypothetical protein
MIAANAPLYINPQILNQVLKYVFLPSELRKGYTNHKKPGMPSGRWKPNWNA